MFTNLMIHKNFPHIRGVNLLLVRNIIIFQFQNPLIFHHTKLYDVIISIFTIFVCIIYKNQTSEYYFTPLMCWGCNDHFSLPEQRKMRQLKPGVQLIYTYDKWNFDLSWQMTCIINVSIT